MPGSKQAWPIVAACWSPATPRMGIVAPNSVSFGSTVIGRAILDLRQHGARDAENIEELIIPFIRRDVEEQRP